ncbi:MAG: universal stress protein [Gemmatimonadota bacterium]
MSRKRNDCGHPTLLVGISNPATMSRLAHLSSLLAKTGPFDLLLTHVVTVASQISLTSGRSSPETFRARDFLREALREVETFGLKARALVEVARSVDEGLVAASRSRKAELILVGYSEEKDDEGGRREKRFDRTMHRVARNAKCDLVVAKFRQKELKTVLVPLGPEPRLRVTGLLCRALGSMEGTTLRFLHVVPPDSSIAEAQRRMEEILESEGLSTLGELEVVATDSVLDILETRATDQDLVIVGPAVPSSPMEAIFTSTGEKIAERVSSSVLLTRARESR